jgi:hypothetical protein
VVLELAPATFEWFMEWLEGDECCKETSLPLGTSLVNYETEIAAAVQELLQLADKLEIVSLSEYMEVLQ